MFPSCCRTPHHSCQRLNCQQISSGIYQLGMHRKCILEIGPSFGLRLTNPLPMGRFGNFDSTPVGVNNVAEGVPGRAIILQPHATCKMGIEPPLECQTVNDVVYSVRALIEVRYIQSRDQNVFLEAGGNSFSETSKISKCCLHIQLG